MTQNWKVEDYLHELDHLTQLLKLPNMDHLHQSMVKSFCLKIQANKDWSSHTILQVIEKLSQCDLSNDAQGAIQQAFNNLGLTDSTTLQVVLKGQQVQDFTKYLSIADWTKMEENPGNVVLTMSVCAARLRAMGMSSLKEATKKQAMAVVFFLAMDVAKLPQFSPATRKKMVEDFQGIFACTPRAAVASLQQYPSDPKDLGQEWLSQVYGQDKPAMRDIPQGWKTMVACQH